MLFEILMSLFVFACIAVPTGLIFYFIWNQIQFWKFKKQRRLEAEEFDKKVKGLK